MGVIRGWCGLLLLVGSQQAWAQTTATFTGMGLVYGGPQDNMSPEVASFGVKEGACGYGEMDRLKWPHWHAASLSFSSPIMASRTLPRWACGVCLSVTCTDPKCKPGGSPVTVTVTDTCASCGANDISIQALSFGLLGDVGVGRLNISYKEVPCEPPGNMVAKVMDARPSQGGYLKIVNTQVAGDAVISDVKVRQAGETEWVDGTNGWGATWEFNKFGIPEVKFPLDLLITGAPGSTPHLEPGIILSIDPIHEYQTSFQLGGGGAPAGAPARLGLPPAAAPAPGLAAALLAAASAPAPDAALRAAGPAEAPEGLALAAATALTPAPLSSGLAPAPLDVEPAPVPAPDGSELLATLAPAPVPVPDGTALLLAPAPAPVLAPVAAPTPGAGVERPAVSLQLVGVDLGPNADVQQVQRIVNNDGQRVEIGVADR